MASGDEQPTVNTTKEELPKEDGNPLVLKPDESPKANEASSEEEEEPEVQSPSAGSNDHFLETGEKRMRKKVQRLSETLSKAHDAKIEQRVKAVKELFEAGSGTALGDIPRIDASFRKLQPISLKPLHLVIYGRLGSINEVRSNLRKFRGFPFKSASPEYAKKLAHIEQRPMNELREVLRILSLEVTGTREVVATRLLDFLLHPSADKVKYKGQVKSGRKSIKKGEKKSKRKSSGKKTPGKTPSSEGSRKDASHTEEDEASDSSSNVSSLQDQSSGEEYAAANKKAAQSKSKNAAKRPAKRRTTLDESDSEPDTEASAPRATPKRTKTPAKSAPADSDEDAPLSALAPSKKPSPPSDSDLKENIVALLKTVNLEETSLRVVREQIFARYPGVDLSAKRDFINTTVKEYLAQS